MVQFIKISVLDMEEENVFYGIEISNGRCQSSLDFYGSLDTFINFGRQLSEFPQNIKDSIRFEIGEDNRKWAYYLLLNVFCFDPSGHAAISTITDSFGSPPHAYRTQFSILSEPASINSLGQMLLKWQPSKSETMYWESYRP